MDCKALARKNIGKKLWYKLFPVFFFVFFFIEIFVFFFFFFFFVYFRVLAWFWKKMPNLGQNFFFGSAEVLGLGGLVLAFLGFPSSTLTVVGSFQKNGQVLD